MTAQEYFGDWQYILNLQEAQTILHKLTTTSFSTTIPSICPLPKNIFRAFHLCPFHNLKIILLAQDPYPTLKRIPIKKGATVSEASASEPPSLTPVATGLAFANSPDTSLSSYSSSLKVLRESVIDFTIPHGIINFAPDLEKWEKQGVLLLNTALSCETGKPGSHSLLWRPFMVDFLTNLSKCSTGIIYILMGAYAQSMEEYINQRFNYVFKIKHPEWYARNKMRMPSDIWRQVNRILIGQTGSGIEWYEEQ